MVPNIGGATTYHPREKSFGEIIMSWTSPVIVEICLGMEVTSYASAVA